MSAAASGSPGTPERLEGSLIRTSSAGVIHLRHCRGLAEFDACVDLQQETWSYPDRELAPRKTFLLAQELGGQVIGAFDSSGRLVAFAMAMAAIQQPGRGAKGDAVPEAYLHSHMLAVRPQYQSNGIGQRLKLVQREDALERGIGLMTWTFDPTAGRNANLNLHRLGAIARRYSPDFYGVSSSRLQAGLPSDRLHAEWWLRSPRVCTQAKRLLETSESDDRITTPSPASAATPERTILLPAALDSWKETTGGIAQAHALQQSNRELLQRAFADGLAATGFHRDAAGNGVYELSRWSPPTASHSSITVEDGL